MNKSKVLLTVGLLATSFSAQSQLITVDFAGNVTDLGVLLMGDGVVVGSSVSGSFSYDTNGGGALSSFDISIGGVFTSSMTGAGVLNVQNDQQNGSATLPADGLTAITGDTTSSAINGLVDPTMQFGLLRENVSGHLWHDTMLPDLSDWANVTLADINDPDWRWLDFEVPNTNHFSDDQIRFDVSSFEVSAVPVPAAIWLFGSGLIGLMAISRSRMKS